MEGQVFRRIWILFLPGQETSGSQIDVSVMVRRHSQGNGDKAYVSQSTVLLSRTSAGGHTATEHGRHEKGRQTGKQQQIDHTASQTDKEIHTHTETIG